MYAEEGDKSITLLGYHSQNFYWMPASSITSTDIHSVAPLWSLNSLEHFLLVSKNVAK